MGELTTALREIATSGYPGDAPIATAMMLRATQAVELSAREQQSDRCAECGQRTNYNGWENYETWAVHLWLSSAEGDESITREIVEEADERARGDALRDWVESGGYSRAIGLATESTGLLSDLLGHALQRVNWEHVARAFASEE